MKGHVLLEDVILDYISLMGGRILLEDIRRMLSCLINGISVNYPFMLH